MAYYPSLPPPQPSPPPPPPPPLANLNGMMIGECRIDFLMVTSRGPHQTQGAQEQDKRGAE